MRFCLLLLVLLMSVACAYAEEPDYEDPDYVNRMEAEDIAGAIKRGDISDLSVINDNNMKEVVRQNPELLADDEDVFERLDNMAAEDTSLINDNPEIKEIWFRKHGLTDGGGSIKSYDGSKIITAGDRSTTIDAYAFVDVEAKVWPDGSVTLSGGPRVSGASVTRDQQGFITIDGGEVDASAASHERTDIIILGSTVRVGDHEFYSDNDITLTSMNGMTYVSGTDVIVEGNRPPGSVVTGAEGNAAESIRGIVGRFSGQAGIFDNNIMVYEGSYTHMGIEGETFTVEADKPLYLVNAAGEGNCIEGTSCIRFNYHFHENLYGDDEIMQLKVDAAENSHIKITSEQGRVDMININPINDNSHVVYDDGLSGNPPRGGLITMDSDGVYCKGNPSEIHADFIAGYYNSEGEIVFVSKEGDNIESCTSAQLAAGECEHLMTVSPSQNPGGVRVTHIAANYEDGQDASLKGARANGNIDFVGTNAKFIDNVNLEDTEVLMLTGHHYEGDDSIWGVNGEMHISEIESSDNVEVVMTSSCNSVRNPEESEGENVLYELNERFPNLKLVVGYDSTAPAEDGDVWEDVLTNWPSEIDNPSEFGNNILQTQQNNIEQRYKMGIYVKEGDRWVFYSNDHPEGINVPEPPVRVAAADQ